MNDLLIILAQNGPTLLAVTLAFLVIYRAGERTQRIADAVEQGLVKDALSNYKAYCMASLYAGAASLQALSDVAEKMGWHKTSAAAKVIQPGLVAIIAYTNKAPEPKP